VGKALILMYHRVSAAQSDPWSLCVSVPRFAEQLAILQKQARLLRLQQLTKVLQEGTTPSRSVVVTFDDGYADNLHNAKPLLEQYEIPATVFITTGPLDRAGAFWWDELERVLLQPGTLPAVLSLRIDADAHQWELGDSAHYDEAAFQDHRGWRAWQPAPTLRHSVYLAVWQMLRPLPEGQRRTVLDELLSWAGAGLAGGPLPGTLSSREVVALAQGELVEIGAHTVTHPMLAALPADSQREEIYRSKVSLEGILGYPVTSFSYPYGSRDDETVSLVREAGFACACSTRPGAVGHEADPLQLPRFQVEDWTGDEFATRLSQWFES